MKKIRIEQVDVWTFGDGKPFEAGEDHRRTTFFPPTGMTLQGALRSKFLADSGVSFEKFRSHDMSCDAVAEQIGWPDEKGFGKLRLRGPWLVKGDVLLFPLPADVVKVSDELRILNPIQTQPFVMNLPEGLLPLWIIEKRPIEDENGWLSQSDFMAYLQNKLTFKAIPTTQLYSHESRFGVKIKSDRKRPQQGHLYSLEYIRLETDVALVVEVDGLPLAQSGWLALGGDSRVARYTLEQDTAPLDASIKLPQRFKIVLVTPAYFVGGWQPTHWDAWFPGARLVAATLKRSLSIGGRDVANNKPKSMRRFVPPGSVYYFERNQPITYAGQPVTEFGAEIGFGQIFTGEWDYV